MQESATKTIVVELAENDQFVFKSQNIPCAVVTKTRKIVVKMKRR
jgi:hypothetical protein